MNLFFLSNLTIKSIFNTITLFQEYIISYWYILIPLTIFFIIYSKSSYKITSFIIGFYSGYFLSNFITEKLSFFSNEMLIFFINIIFALIIAFLFKEIIFKRLNRIMIYFNIAIGSFILSYIIIFLLADFDFVLFSNNKITIPEFPLGIIENIILLILSLLLYSSGILIYYFKNKKITDDFSNELKKDKIKKPINEKKEMKIVNKNKSLNTNTNSIKQIKNLDLYIGKRFDNDDKLLIELNNTKIHANSHLAIMGKPGVGKTQFLLKLLTDIRILSNFNTNIILFDYKGDVIDNRKFIELIKAEEYKLLQNNDSLPINPFILDNYDDQAIQVSAREKAESFASINSKLGVVQKGILTDAIIESYSKRKENNNPFPDFNDVLEQVGIIYEQTKRKDDSLIEVLRDLANFNLFWSHDKKNKPFDRILDRTMIIDLHSMPVLKELVAYLVIEKIYKEMTVLNDSKIKNGRRHIRTILVIDEAHNYLNQENIFLQRIIREGRSKGIVVFFASQSPSDYQQRYFNFQELLEFAFIFQSKGVSVGSVQELLGCNQKIAKDAQTEIAKLEPFQVISKSNNKDEDLIKFNAELFYKNY